MTQIQIQLTPLKSWHKFTYEEMTTLAQLQARLRELNEQGRDWVVWVITPKWGYVRMRARDYPMADKTLDFYVHETFAHYFKEG